MVDLVKLNSEPIELTTGFLDDILQLLKQAHDEMDDINAHGIPSRDLGCVFCSGTGYSSTRLIHSDDCILVKIRKVINV